MKEAYRRPTNQYSIITESKNNEFTKTYIRNGNDWMVFQLFLIHQAEGLI